MRLRPAFIALTLPLWAFAQPTPEKAKVENTYSLDRMVVTGQRPSAAEAGGPDGIRTYDESEIESSGAFSLEEFIESLPRGSGEGQLILVDGVQMELSDLTPAMVASIEVSYSGAMPAYGAYARGRIVNIRLKQEYDGRELGLEGAGSIHADAWRSEGQLSGGVIRGPWRLTYSATYVWQDAVTADARDFSREQDHRARGGRDFRVPWGDPAVVQAVAGNLNGVVDAAGNPVSVALVPVNAAGIVTPAGFLPGAGPSASGQRFFNTSPYLYLASPAESLGARIALNRTFGKLQLGVSANYRLGRNRRDGPPPVSAASADTRVPAAFNPFGQDVLVGLVHTGFGPVRQESENDTMRVILSANWMGRNNWRINSSLAYTGSQSTSDSRDLDQAAFGAALASPNPATRFNPFVGAGSLANAALYPALAVHRTQEQANRSTRYFGLASGPVAQGWGAGPVRLSLNGNASWRDDERITRNLRGVADGVTGNYDANYGLGAYLDAPLLKDRPRFYRLDGRMSGNYSANSGGGDTRRQGAGVLWSPARAWSFRANAGWSLSSPGEQGDDDPMATVETLMDPRRAPTSAENVQVTSRRSNSTESSRGDDLQFAMTYEPAAKPGLQFSVEYSQQSSSRATGSPFRAQDVVDNETLFTGRVIRDAPTAADLALGQPGRILSVDTTAVAVASDERRALNFGVEYQLAPGSANRVPGRGISLPPAGGPGAARAAQRNRFTFSLNAEYPLESRYEVAEGQAFVSREGGPANRPDWNASGRVRWINRQWNVGLQLRHNAASRLGTIPAVTSAGFDVVYRFEQAVWGKFGKNLRLRLQVQNLIGNEPPYADTILGYRGGSPVGTTVGFSLNTPW